MKSVLTGIILVAIIAILAAGVFFVQDHSAETTFTSENGSVRLSD